jgi:hypothetical protein
MINPLLGVSPEQQLNKWKRLTQEDLPRAASKHSLPLVLVCGLRSVSHRLGHKLQGFLLIRKSWWFAQRTSHVAGLNYNGR